MDNLSLGLLRLLGQKDGLDVGQNSSLGDGDAGQKLVQLLVIPDGELQVSWDDSGFLVVPGGVTGQLENLSAQVLEHGGQVDWGASSDSLGVVAFSQKSVDSADWELKAGSAGSRLGLGFRFSGFSFARHGGS